MLYYSSGFGYNLYLNLVNDEICTCSISGVWKHWLGLVFVDGSGSSVMTESFTKQQGFVLTWIKGRQRPDTKTKTWISRLTECRCHGAKRIIH